MKSFKKLLNIMNYKRPAGSGSEAKVIHNYLDCIEGMRSDDFGNRILEIGDSPVTMFSCHTDTVHDSGGKQKVYIDSIKNEMFVTEDCLGADDAAGMIILISLIQAGIPGLYVFHRLEERGGQGSNYIQKETPDLIENISRCIAFDRKGTTSIITYQGGERCCSDKFSAALGLALQTDSMFWMDDDTGSFTDSANYTHIIPECTNVSCGYSNEHRPAETLNLSFLKDFCEHIVTVNFNELPTVRNPDVPEFKTYKYPTYNKNIPKYDKYGYPITDTKPELTLLEMSDYTLDACACHEDFVDFLYDYPDEAANILQEYQDFMGSIHDDRYSYKH